MFSKHRLRVALVAVAAGLAAVWGVRALDAERYFFHTVARGFNSGPLFLTGDGSHARPWSLRVKAPVTAIDPERAPVVVSLGDDAMGLFQTRPPSPVDIAAVLRYLRRVGGANAAIAAVFQWQEANPLAYQGLETVMDEFRMTIQAAPLKRGTVVDDMPAAFQRAALAADAVTGNTSDLPMVNGLAVKEVFLGGAKTLAGFSTLDDVTLADRVPLLARWQDDKDGRVVLAFPLLAVLARHDLPVTGIRARLGETLELSPAGPMVPIDANGCMLLPPRPVPARVDVEAAELVMAEPGFLPRDAGLIVLRDDQSASDEATKRFSANLASVMAAIESDGGLAAPRLYPRLAGKWEAMLAAVLLGCCLVAGGLPPFGRNVVLGCLVAVALAGQWLGFGLAGVWLPGVGLLSGLVVYWWQCVGDPQPAPAPTADAVAGSAGTSLRTVTIWREPAAASGPAPAPTAIPAQQPEVPSEYLFPPRPEPEPEPLPWPEPEPPAWPAEPAEAIPPPPAIPPSEAPDPLPEPTDEAPAATDGTEQAPAGDTPAPKTAPRKTPSRKAGSGRKSKSHGAGGTASESDTPPPS